MLPSLCSPILVTCYASSCRSIKAVAADVSPATGHSSLSSTWATAALQVRALETHALHQAAETLAALVQVASSRSGPSQTPVREVAVEVPLGQLAQGQATGLIPRQQRLDQQWQVLQPHSLAQAITLAAAVRMEQLAVGAQELQQAGVAGQR